ncbi:hypothetical protein [Streptomyces alanosinicus]|uniref:Uncharacterized protein n=1 Tax=Streptomyces alanosinicus TaxID=68171 RepID=A0A918YMA6_9ACTN|nr:hypothetical protein [Streptomyces alanosinicus]GHE09199.1 hypothetical protein GCM10010339_60650 [Streptomyces alanosinicus]
MHTMTPDPLAVLQVAADHSISEEQAATAIEWAAHMTVHAWESYADTLGLAKHDGDAMEAWFRSLPPGAQNAVLDDAVTVVVGADNVLAEIYRKQDAKQASHRRVMRTNRPRVHIR